MNATRTVMRHARSLLLLLAAALACSDGTASPCACTEEFRTYTVTVLDDASQPIRNLTLVRTNLRTGKVLEPGWLGMLVPGTYLVADDGLLEEFSDAGDTLRVAITQSGASVTVDYVLRTPAACRCHVELVAGPDTVVIGEAPPIADSRIADSRTRRRPSAIGYRLSRQK